MEKNVYKEIVQILAKTFKLDPNLIKPQALLKDDLGLDSVDIMDAICLFEEQFKIKILQDLNSIKIPLETVDDLNKFIQEKSSEKV